jgi:hypothetical protein
VGGDEGFRGCPGLESLVRLPACEHNVCAPFRGAQDLHIYKPLHLVNGAVTPYKSLFKILLAAFGHRDAIHNDNHLETLRSSDMHLMQGLLFRAGHKKTALIAEL